jgi:hypothetical protein
MRKAVSTITSQSGQRDDIDDLAAQLARRREAALRLPPLQCGCRDPEAWEHLVERCRFASRRAA